MRSFLQPGAGLALGLYARLLARTVRLRVVGEENLRAAEASGRPLIFAAWHGQTHILFPLMRQHIDAARLVMMVVGDERAGVLLQFARTVGISSYPVSMDDQSMAGARNLMRMIQRMRQGAYSYMTPDGPDGPARQPKAGVVFLAQRAGAALVPLGGHCRRCYHLRRWDRYALPVPWTRVEAGIGPAIYARPDSDPQELTQSLAAGLDAVVEQAGALARGGG